MATTNALCSWTALNNEPPSASFATVDMRNAHPVLDFDADADESAVFRGIIPAHYAGGGLTVKLYWTATSGVADDVAWDAAIERHQAGTTDLDADDFAAAQAATTTTSATSGAVNVTTITFTSGAQMDSLAAGEMFRLKITRDADNGGDTMTGDAELHAVLVQET